jgi:mRNA interferase RelE/StbE
VYEVQITPEGLRHLNQLPGKVRDAAIQAMLGPIAEHPRRVGKPLVGELTGLHSARRGDYRVSYEIDDDRRSSLSTECNTAASSTGHGDPSA